MAKEKVTITLDRTKADRARALVSASSTSEVIDLALDYVIRAERPRRDVDAYRRPPTGEELPLASAAEPGALADDTDWEALYSNSAT